MMVKRVMRRLVTRLKPRAEKGQRVNVALTHNRNACLKQQRSGDADALPVTSRLNEPTTIGNYLSSTRCTHVCQNGDISVRFLREREHRACALDHLGSQVDAMLIEDAGAPRHDVDAIATVDVWHRPGCPESVLLGTKWEGNKRGQ
jgi:hypothetical protein